MNYMLCDSQMTTILKTQLEIAIKMPSKKRFRGILTLILTLVTEYQDPMLSEIYRYFSLNKMADFRRIQLCWVTSNLKWDLHYLFHSCRRHSHPHMYNYIHLLDRHTSLHSDMVWMNIHLYLWWNQKKTQVKNLNKSNSLFF